jgi:hypothetical protein
MRSKPLIPALLALGLISLGLFAYFGQQSKDNKPATDEGVTKSQEDGSKVVVGGVPRSPNEVETLSHKRSTREKKLKPHGFAPGLKPDENPYVESVATALVSRTNPERYSSFVVPKSFDADAFASRGREYSEEYAKVVEPGRVFASAQPGPDAKPIRNESPRYHRLIQGESVTLKVRSAPNSPVTFTSFDLGSFSNKLSSITVVASSEGIAETTFTAGGGTIDEVQIMAASPVNSGRVNFLVTVQLPK